MLFLAVVIIAKGGDSGNSLTVFNPGETSLLGVTGGGVLGGILIGILLFVGFEAAASIGEESNDPHNSIPRAVLGTIAASAAFYVVMSYAIAIGYGKSAVEAGKWISDPAYLDTMATRYVGSWLATIIDLVVILDALGLALAICVTIGRGYFALGRDGLLPSFFARTSRYDTPWVGNLMDGGLLRDRARVPDPCYRVDPARDAEQGGVVAVHRRVGRHRHPAARLLRRAQP